MTKAARSSGTESLDWRTLTTHIMAGHSRFKFRSPKHTGRACHPQNAVVQQGSLKIRFSSTTDDAIWAISLLLVEGIEDWRSAYDKMPAGLRINQLEVLCLPEPRLLCAATASMSSSSCEREKRCWGLGGQLRA